MAKRLRFGHCEVRPEERMVLLDGRVVHLGARAFDVLLALVERRDRIVSKAELLELAWPGLMVEENNLSVQISAVRKALGPHAISTIPALGYRFAMGSEAIPPEPKGDGRYVTEPTQVSEAEVAAFGSGPTQLAARLSDARNPTRAWRAGAADTAVEPIILAHEGRLQPGSAEMLVASFPNAHAAAACCHKLHEFIRTSSSTTPAAPPLAWHIGLSSFSDVGGPPEGLAVRLAALARAGETLLSAEIANHLILKFDGDLKDLGAQDLHNVDKSIRVFRLTASVPEDEGDASARRTDDLRPTVALIPFSPYTRENAPAYLGDVIADQVISALSKSHAINVISRLSTLAFRDRDASVQQISRRLAANFVVTGRYWLASGRLSVHVELAEAAGAKVLWTHDVVDDERAALDPDSTLVHEMVAGIVQAVFRHELRSLRGSAMPDLGSHTLLLAAISLLYRLSPRDFTLARKALDTLRERAPRHPAPLAWLARWHLFRVVQGWTDNREEDGRLALDHANRALDLDPDSSLALTMLGNVNTSVLRDLDRADSLYDQALEINPNESLAWLQKGNARSFRGDGASALGYAEKAVSLSPLDPSHHFYLSILASAALTARDFPRAITAARSSLRLNHEHVSTHRVLAIALSMSGRIDEARDSVREVLRLEPRLTVADFIARSPGAQSGLAQTFGRALHDAGLPAGPLTSIPTTGG